MAIVETLLTAKEFGALPDDGRRTELVRGGIVELPFNGMLHGHVCSKVNFALASHAKNAECGHVLLGGTEIITERNPDTVRGLGVLCCSYEQLPKECLPDTQAEDAPELAIEVLNPWDHWWEILARVVEYLKMGVPVVCVLDPGPETAHLYYPDKPNVTLGPDNELTFPE